MSEENKFSSVALNPMVRRQTPQSRFSHFQSEGADVWHELERLVADALANYPDAVKVLTPNGNVVKVRLPEHLCEGRFFTGVVKLEPGMDVRTVFAVRQGGMPGELPYQQTVVVGAAKTPSKWVDVIVYHRDELKLEERTWTPPGQSAPETVDADWQVISVNAHITAEDEPPTPQAMARNHAAAEGRPEGVGGSARQYTAAQYMEALLFWGSHAMVADADA